MAEALSRYLVKLLQNRDDGTRWIVVAYSLGGGIWYRWLQDHVQKFYGETGIAPKRVFTLAAPYNWDNGLMDGPGQDFHLEDGPSITLKNERQIGDRAIVEALSGRVVVIIAEDDDVTPKASPALISIGKTQYLLTSTRLKG